MKSKADSPPRILVIDDNPAIHEDFRKILAGTPALDDELGAMAANLFDRLAPRSRAIHFEIDSASSGQEGLEKVCVALREERRYDMAFVDVRMPNGWDGIETISRIWEEHGDLLVVICTAFSDHSWEEIQKRLGDSDRFLILKKPFDNLEVRQLTYALTERSRAERELVESEQKLRAEGAVVQRLGGDITELKRVQNELRLAHGEVARANEALRSEIAAHMRAEAEATAAKEEAEKANRAKSEFLSRTSHELRTPMNAVLGFAQLLELENLAPDSRQSVEQILKAGRHLLEVINEVLDISSVESGGMTLSLEAVEVDTLVREASHLLSPLAASGGVRLDVVPSCGSDLHVLADRHRLKQVLLNLLSNAIKYNRAGGVVAMACAQRDDAPGVRLLRISVSDNGPGISADKLSRLFMPFDRLDAERTHVGVEGVGLGLALSKRLVEVMGGTLGVDSQPGGGSAFWLELPLVESPLSRAYPALASTPASSKLEQPKTIVYIEDNFSNLKLIEVILLRRPGIKLLAAMQGELGLDLIREYSPDLVLLDLNLAGFSGQKVLAELRSHPETREIPVIVISADATVGQVSRVLAAGAQAYLTKPFDIGEFLKVVDRALAGGKTAPAG